MTTGAGRLADPAAPAPRNGSGAAVAVDRSTPPTDVSPPVVDGGSRGRKDGPEASGQQEPSTPVAFEAAESVPKALQVVGSIVAPTTLLTALFIYFGLMYAIGYYRYFGVNYTVLDLPTQGLLILSASTAVVPLATLATVLLVTLWIYRLPLERSSNRVRRWLSVTLLPAVAVGGAALLAMVAVETLLRRQMFPPSFPEARGIALSAGVVLLAWAARLRTTLVPAGAAEEERETAAIARTPRGVPALARRALLAFVRPAKPDEGPGHVALTVAKWACLCVLFGIGLFWAVGSYALRLGPQDAHGFVSNLRCAPDVVVYSEKSLNLLTAGVTEEPATSPDGAYGFRYRGLKLVPQAGDQYLLVPANWAPAASPAIVLPRSDTLRLEFTPVASTELAPC
jgi:hypothetical protein